MPRESVAITRPAPFRRLSHPAIAALLAGAISFTIYLATMPPTILDGDGGELISAARVLGISHPTGYPLYLLLSRLFLFLPFSNPAIRVTLLSALSAAGAVGCVAWTGALLTSSLAAGLLAGLVAGLNRPLWSQATQPEVYALNALLIALACLVAVRGQQHPRPHHIVWLALIAGLGLAHHRTSLSFALPLLLATALVHRPGTRVLWGSLAAFIAPLLLYLYLPLRAAAHPPVMWADTTRWDQFLTHVMGGQYGKYAFARSLPFALELGGKVAYDFAAALTLPGTLLLLLGLVTLFQRSRVLSLSLLFSCALLTVWNLGYDVADVVDFFVPCWLVFGLWVAEGLTVAQRGLCRLTAKGPAWVPAVLVAAAVVLIPVNLTQRHWTKCNRHHRWRDYDAGRLLLSRLPAHGLYVTSTDDFVLMYLQQVEGFRRDIAILRPIGTYLTGPRVTEPDLARALADPVDRFDARVHGGVPHEEYDRNTLLFAVDLADQIGSRRPVYCYSDGLRPPFDLPLQALSTEHFRIARDGQPAVVSAAPRTPVAGLTPTISLAQCLVTPPAAKPRNLVRLQLDWCCTAEVTQPLLLDLRLAPPGLPLNQAIDWDYLLHYQTWLASGRLPLPATSPGSAYRQDITLLLPTNGPPGEWILLATLLSETGPAPQYHDIAHLTVSP